MWDDEKVYVLSVNNYAWTMFLRNSGMKVTDFGESRFGDMLHFDVPGTLQFLAPELLLKLGCTFPYERFGAAGLILFEEVTGKPPFNVIDEHTEREHFGMTLATRDAMLKRFLKKTQRERPEWFTGENSAFALSQTSSGDVTNYIGNLATVREQFKLAEELAPGLTDVAMGMLSLNPVTRIEPRLAAVNFRKLLATLE